MRSLSLSGSGQPSASSNPSLSSGSSGHLSVSSGIPSPSRSLVVLSGQPSSSWNPLRVSETRNGFQDEDGCPDNTTNDRDGDGIPDDTDKCPDDPEDKDGFEDADGCPDPDNDKDRILDVSDKCPNEPETYNGVEDEDGCPDKGRVIVKRGKIEILDKIYFETDKADIKPISFPLLDAIAATIKGNPQLQLIEIQGHADERGPDDHNLDLTDRRANAVMHAMIERGVEPGRLRARGYGELKPICGQRTEDCWSQNRRVEFIILRRTDDAGVFKGDDGQ